MELRAVGNDFFVESRGNLNFKVGKELQMKSGGNLLVESGRALRAKLAAAMLLQASGNAALESGGETAVRGAVLKLNNGSRPVMVSGLSNRRAPPTTVFAP